MTHPSWVILHVMAYSFIELHKPLCHDKAVICEGDRHELGQTSGDGAEGGGLVSFSPWGHKESDTTGQLNNSSDILLYVCVYMYIYIYTHTHTHTHTPHLLYHSSVDGHLHCFLHILATINNISVNTGVHVSFQIDVFPFFVLGVAIKMHLDI